MLEINEKLILISFVQWLQESNYIFPWKRETDGF